MGHPAGITSAPDAVQPSLDVGNPELPAADADGHPEGVAVCFPSRDAASGLRLSCSGDRDLHDPMESYKQEFIEFMVRAGVLTFGDFVTKSGRETPYFVNTGRYRTGRQMRALAGYYASAIQARMADRFDVLFGPAYKGIPLCVSTAMALSSKDGPEVPFCFNRKEVKDHGEGGSLVGHPLADGDRVLIIEDVTTAGTAIRETVPLLKASADISLAGLVVSVDRMERGQGEKRALVELSETYQMPTFAIVTVREVIEHLHGRALDGQVLIDDAIRSRMEDYLSRYGA